MNAEIPTSNESNVAAHIAVGSAIVGILIIPIILAPLAIIAGLIGLNGGKKGRGPAGIAIVLGFFEVVYILVQWHAAGLV